MTRPGRRALASRRLVGCAVVMLGASTPAVASPLKWPFSFDPAIAANPGSVQQKLAAGDAAYPDLPVGELTALQSDQVTLYFFPEVADMLERARTAADAPPMVWPTTPSMCVAHAAFSMPTLLTASPSPTCGDAEATIRQRLTTRTACLDVDQPERFALAFEPSQARASTASIEAMIGQAGEAWTHAAAPQLGLLPADFVPSLRVALLKIRHATLAQQLDAAQAAYTEAIAIASGNPSCFDPTVTVALVTGVGALLDEVVAARNHLDQVEGVGLAAANQEQVCLAARGRARRPLSHPSLTRAERELLAMWLGGIYWRMRGGGLIPLGSTQDARWFFLHQAFAQIGRMVGGTDGVDAALQLYLPIFEGWGEWHDMGQTPGGDDRYDDLVSMTARGERQVSLAADLLAQRSYDTLALTVGGLAMGPCYFRGFYPMADFRYAAQLLPSPPYGDGISGPTTIGELCTGAAIGLGLARVLLDGVPSGQPPVELCASRSCGEDGCGGSCGRCADSLTCADGACVACVPACAGQGCGEPDGCGGACDECENETTSSDDGGAGCGCGTTSVPLGGPPAVMIALAWILGRRRRRTSHRVAVTVAIRAP